MADGRECQDASNSVGESKMKSVSLTMTPEATPSHSKTELPHLSATFYEAFEKRKVYQAAEGSKALELATRLEGRLGSFWSRSQGDVPKTYYDINVINFHNTVAATLKDVVRYLLRDKDFTQDAFVQTCAETCALNLTRGIMVTTYMRLHHIQGMAIGRAERFCRKPEAPLPYEVPKPYAFAIEQLGVVEVASLPYRQQCIPSASADDCARLLLPNDGVWIPTVYAEAVEYAKKIGMEFATPNLKLKFGSAWWLHKTTALDEFQSIDCPLPEDNFTETTAVLRSLFCTGTYTDFGPALFNLDGLDQVYSHVMVNPRAGINLATYFAIIDEDKT